MEITINELRQMKHKEGMILQGCGGDIPVSYTHLTLPTNSRV